MIVVELNSTEKLEGAFRAVMRQVQNHKKDRQPGYGAGRGNDWQIAIEGALGEQALAKHLGVYHGGIGILRGHDVGNCDVRTRSKDHYDLILHPDDPDDRAFWLLTGLNGVYKIWGWILARDGKKQEYWKDPAGGRAAFFVPKNVLKDPKEYRHV